MVHFPLPHQSEQKPLTQYRSTMGWGLPLNAMGWTSVWTSSASAVGWVEGVLGNRSTVGWDLDTIYLVVGSPGVIPWSGVNCHLVPECCHTMGCRIPEPHKNCKFLVKHSNSRLLLNVQFHRLCSSVYCLITPHRCFCCHQIHIVEPFGYGWRELH